MCRPPLTGDTGGHMTSGGANRDLWSADETSDLPDTWHMSTATKAPMVELGTDDALGLLPATGMGRVAVTTGALPKILVVRYAPEAGNGDILFAPASPHPPTALRGTVVAFEASGGGPSCDGCGSASWSVGITGIATPLPTGALASLPGHLGSLDMGGGVFRLTPSMVTGLRFA